MALPDERDTGDRRGADDPLVPRIPPLPRAEWDDAAREVFAYWGEPDAWENGSKTNIQMVLANHPALATAYNNFGRHLFVDSSAAPWAREIVTLRVAWHLRSRYEWHYHVGYALNLGMTPDQIRSIGIGPTAQCWNERDAALLGLVDELWARSRVSDETWRTLQAHFGKHELMDLTFTIGAYVMLGWAIAVFGVEFENGVDPVDFDLRTPSGRPAAARLKPGEREDWAREQYDRP